MKTFLSNYLINKTMTIKSQIFINNPNKTGKKIKTKTFKKKKNSLLYKTILLRLVLMRKTKIFNVIMIDIYHKIIVFMLVQKIINKKRIKSFTKKFGKEERWQDLIQLLLWQVNGIIFKISKEQILFKTYK